MGVRCSWGWSGGPTTEHWFELHAYCSQCRARVTAREGRCLLDHPIDLDTLAESSGRHLRSPSSRRPKARSVRSDQTIGSVPTVTVVDLTELTEARPLVRVGPSSLPDPPAAPLLDEPPFPDATTDVTSNGHVGPPSWTPPPPLEGPPSTLHELAPTGELIAAMWEREGAVAVDAPWDAAAVDETLLEDERPRWRRRVVIGLISLAAGWSLSGFLGDGGSALVGAIEQKANTLSAALAALDPVVTDLGDGMAGDTLTTGSTLSEVDRAARDLFASAAALDPEVESDAALRRAVSDLATNALTVESALGDLTGYGATITSLVALPELPASTDDIELGEVTASLAAWATHFTDGAGMLPRNAHTDTHRETVIAFGDSLPQWQAGYLDALRTGDTEAARLSADQLRDGVDTLLATWLDTAQRSTESLRNQIAGLMTSAETLNPPS